MSGFLTKDEMAQVKELKEMGILVPFKEGELRGMTKNGGVGVFCGDGDTDAFKYHRKSITTRSHSIKLFGAPYIFAPSIRYYDTGLIEGTLRNMQCGMDAKKTSSSWLYPHWLCGYVGDILQYTMIEALNLMFEVEEVFWRYSKRVTSLYHVAKKFDDGREEQNTYRLALPKKGIIRL